MHELHRLLAGELMKDFQRFEIKPARRKKSPRRVEEVEIKWTIFKENDAYVADSGTGVRVWADEREKLALWIQG